MPQDSALTICVLAGYASARPGVGGDSASDSSVVDDMDRKAAAVAGDGYQMQAHWLENEKKRPRTALLPSSRRSTCLSPLSAARALRLFFPA